ncbi:MAG: hypothetical protein WAZ18_03955 [Alphaproteobacteria bacterium]
MLEHLNLPPELKDKAQKAWAVAKPVVQAAGRTLNTLMTAGRTPTLGDTFSHLCVVGLNKSELLLAGERTPVFADAWQDLADDNLRKGLGLVFFAPRTLEGTPVNPYVFLAGDGAVGAGEGEDTAALAQQTMQGMGLLDFCRMPPAGPNQLNMVLAADVLFHWDVRDNYVLPTTATGWVRDVEQVLKGYPRTTKATLYTNWETDLLPPSDRITVRPLREMPVAEGVWLNQPTFQERYGTMVLAVALMAATGTWLLLHSQSSAIEDVNEQLRVVEQQIPQGGRMSDLAKAVAEEEKFMEKRELFYLAVKDTARAIGTSSMKFDNFEVKQPDPQVPPTDLVATIQAPKDAYQGWLQEEPIAKDVLMASALMTAIRKPPANVFKLEGLIPLTPALKELKALAKASNKGKNKPVVPEGEVQP